MSLSTKTTVSAMLAAMSAKLASARRSFSEPIQYCSRRSMAVVPGAEAMGVTKAYGAWRRMPSVERHQATPLLRLVDVLLQRALGIAVHADDLAAEADRAVLSAGGRDVMQHHRGVDHGAG